MLTDAAAAHYTARMEAIRSASLEKVELAISTPQGPRVDASGKRGLLNLCANNYL